MKGVNEMRERANGLFKSGNFDEALSIYTEALNLDDLKDSEKSVLFRNRSACYLKLGKYDGVIRDASEALNICSNDVKALYRRSQAYNALDQPEQAYKDALEVIKFDPKNKDIIPLLQKLTPLIQDKINIQNSTDSKVIQMIKIVFDAEKSEHDKRLQALNNLVVLAKEDAGCIKIVSEGCIAKIVTMATTEKHTDFVLACLRILSQMCDGREKVSTTVYRSITPQQFLILYTNKDEHVSTATSHLLQNILTYVSGVNSFKAAIQKYNDDKKRGERVRYPQFMMDESAEAIVDEIFTGLTKLLVSNKITGPARDSILQLMTKNIQRRDAIGWTQKFIKAGGIQNLMIIAGSVKQHQMLTVTANSAMNASVALSKIYDDLTSDKERELFKTECESYFRELLGDDSMESKVEAIEAVSVLLQGPYDVGNMLLGIAGVTQIMMVLANSDNTLHQKVAVEAIVHSASKKDKCVGMLKDAVPTLKKLFQTNDDAIKIRALVGLCKLGSFGGTDASERPMAEGSTVALSKSCRKFLADKSRDIDIHKWAVEGLAYLTLDADIKEELINDTEALTSLVNIAKHKDRLVLYSAVTVFMNLTNSYDMPDIPQEMIELAKYAKQHVPTTHPMDEPGPRDNRIKKLTEFGVVSCLVPLSGTDSKNTRELISRIFLSIATDETLRGHIVQQGGAKSLISLSLDNTDNGQVLAAHALAKVAVTINPEIAFPGQRIQEVIRPLLSLLHPDRSGLQNFEALLALTNLTSLNDEIRARILKEKGFSRIEHCMFEEHDMIRRAATECMCNLIMNEEVVELFKGDNDRVKLITLFCGEEDESLVTAAAGGLAMLTMDCEICEKVTKVTDWLNIIQSIAASENVDIQYRGCYILKNLIMSNDGIAQQVIESSALEVLMAVSKMDDPSKKKAKECADEALKVAQNSGFIKPV